MLASEPAVKDNEERSEGDQVAEEEEEENSCVSQSASPVED